MGSKLAREIAEATASVIQMRSPGQVTKVFGGRDALVADCMAEAEASVPQVKQAREYEKSRKLLKKCVRQFQRNVATVAAQVDQLTADRELIQAQTDRAMAVLKNFGSGQPSHVERFSEADIKSRADAMIRRQMNGFSHVPPPQNGGVPEWHPESGR